MREQIGGAANAGVPLAEGDGGDGDGEPRRHVANRGERRIETALLEDVLRHLLCQCLDGREEHLVSDAAGAAAAPRPTPGKMWELLP